MAMMPNNFQASHHLTRVQDAHLNSFHPTVNNKGEPGFEKNMLVEKFHLTLFRTPLPPRPPYIGEVVPTLSPAGREPSGCPDAAQTNITKFLSENSWYDRKIIFAFMYLFLFCLYA
jgi:hypothetical protein